ncbi:peptidase family M3 [Colletotrichum tamarilloi]|nr:peptidase family M3 [Colletotrichum tamarilloi]KAK1489120.1 peptidase family M3 [Colletotrichum tamarilloi]
MSSNQYDAQASTNYKEAFSLFDKRGNGRVAIDSLGDLLRACGQNPTLTEIRDLEKNVGGDFDFETFQRILNRPGGFRDPGEPEDHVDPSASAMMSHQALARLPSNKGPRTICETPLASAWGVTARNVVAPGARPTCTFALNLACHLPTYGIDTSTCIHPRLPRVQDLVLQLLLLLPLPRPDAPNSPTDRTVFRPVAVASSKRPLLSLTFFLIFLLTALILAAPRAVPRITSLFAQLRFKPVQLPLVATPSLSTYRPLVTAAMTVPDKYKSPPQAPPVFTGTKESIVGDSKKICDQTRALLDKLVADYPADKATFENVMKPIAKDENESGLSTRILGFYQYVSSDAALREASTQADTIMDEFSIEVNMREDVYKLIEALHQRKDSEGLDPESLRLLEKDYKNYIKMGLGIPAGPQRDRFKEIKKRLSQIQIEFTKNLNEENGGIWFTKEELDGVSDDVLDGLEKGTGENEGKLKLSFKYPDLFPTLKFAKNPETRRKVFIQNENKCNQNVPLFQEAIILRDEAARMLGYPNHAALRIEDKMAKTTKTVNDFLGDLRSRLTAGGAKEVEHLQELKKADTDARGVENDGNYYLWDHKFYDRLMIEKEYSIDENKIAEYFPITSTIAGMLKIFEELLGFVFVELKPEDRKALSPTGKGEDIAWHEDVIIFSVWDDASEGEGFVGYLYLDLHPRQGKYGHAANFNLQPGYLQANGSRRYPATALVCNFSKPTPKKPSLLKHDEVVTLFHELGHGIHDLAGRCTYSRFHGTSTVRDFVEAPSQMLENWCWTPSVIKALSQHYETGEKIPDDLIEKQISTKHVNAALFNLRQLHFGTFDMTVHTPESHEAIKKLDLSATYNELRGQIAGIKGPEAQGEKSTWGNGQACFGHLIGGYDAGYYGYLSSEVYSTDMFYSVFKADPMNGKEGRRYRHTVLEKGGSQEEMLTLEQFLGRKPSTEAFYKELGIPQTLAS